MYKLHYLDFKNIGELRQWAKKQPSYKRHSNKFINRSNCLSTHVEAMMALDPDDQFEFVYEDYVEGLTKFSAPKTMLAVEEKFDNEILKIGLQNEIKKPTIKYNDRGLGNFIFERAAMGMFFQKEFYSPSLDEVIAEEEVEEVGHEEYVLAVDGSLVIRRNKMLESGLPAVQSTTKKVFATFDKKGKDANAVEIFVSCGNFDFVGKESFVYSGMEAIMVAKLLMKGGIKVKINAAVGWIDGTANYCVAFCPVKNYNEPLDRNLLCLLTSDNRFWQTEGYTICDVLGSHFKIDVQYGLTGRELKRTLSLPDNNFRPNLKYKFCYGRIQDKDEAINNIRTAIQEISQYIKQEKQYV